MHHTTTDTTPSAIAILEHESRSVAAAFGVQVPDDMAAALVDRILHRLGGERVYLPKRRPVPADVVASGFNGINFDELARQFSCTPRTIRNKISSSQKTDRKAR